MAFESDWDVPQRADFRASRGGNIWGVIGHGSPLEGTLTKDDPALVCASTPGTHFLPSKCYPLALGTVGWFSGKGWGAQATSDPADSGPVQFHQHMPAAACWVLGKQMSTSRPCHRQTLSQGVRLLLNFGCLCILRVLIFGPLFSTLTFND